MRDWAVGQAEGSCYSWAALFSNDSKTRYLGQTSPWGACIRHGLEAPSQSEGESETEIWSESVGRLLCIQAPFSIANECGHDDAFCTESQCTRLFWCTFGIFWYPTLTRDIKLSKISVLDRLKIFLIRPIGYISLMDGGGLSMKMNRRGNECPCSEGEAIDGLAFLPGSDMNWIDPQWGE